MKSGLLRRLARSILLISIATTAAFAQSGAASADPVLAAMQQELARSKAQLKMDGQPAPYYIQYRIQDVDNFDGGAAFGASNGEKRVHARVLRALVRVGDYNHDSYMQFADGTAQVETLDDDSLALRHQMWIATDQAYKIALQALTYKQAQDKQFQSAGDVPDFSKEQPYTYFGPLVSLQDFDSAKWMDIARRATALYTEDPVVQQLNAHVTARAENEYIVDTEGSSLRTGHLMYTLAVWADAQATDGMSIERNKSYGMSRLSDMPAWPVVKQDTEHMISLLKQLSTAPVIDDDYSGPVLLGPDPATSVFEEIFTPADLGVRPPPGKAGRTRGEYSGSMKSRVLPDFLTITDDPTLSDYKGRSLLGDYPADEEGVKARPVTLVDKGELVSYLMSREPVRGFTQSNGHGRAGPGAAVSPSISNLIVTPLAPLSKDEMMQKLISMCKDAGREYCYYVESTAGLDPRLLWRVYTKDGHRELVRGAAFDNLDTRALRDDIVAAGSDYEIDELQLATPSAVVAPSLLFRDLTLKRSDKQLEHLPYYPPPPIASSVAAK